MYVDKGFNKDTRSSYIRLRSNFVKKKRAPPLSPGFWNRIPCPNGFRILMVSRISSFILVLQFMDAYVKTSFSFHAKFFKFCFLLIVTCRFISHCSMFTIKTQAVLSIFSTVISSILFVLHLHCRILSNKKCNKIYVLSAHHHHQVHSGQQGTSGTGPQQLLLNPM